MSTVPSDLITDHAIVKYNDGEGLIHTDLLNQQNQMRASWMDLLAAGYDYSGTYPDLYGGSALSSSTVFVPRVGQGFVEPTGGALGTRLEAGWLAQSNTAFSSFDGSAPRLLMARVDLGAGVHFVHDAADPTNPRIDLLQIRLTEVDDDNVSRDFKDAVTGALSTTVIDKKTRVQIEFQIKNGTPGANPAVPSTDAGWAALTRVRIPALAVSLALDDVIDVRMPMRVSQHRVQPGAMVSDNNDNSWNFRGGPRGKLIDDAVGLHSFCPAGFGNVRILGIWLAALFVESGNEAIELNRITMDGSGLITTQEISDLYVTMGGASSNQLMYTPVLFGTNSVNDNNRRAIWSNYTGVHRNLEDNEGFPMNLTAHERIALTIKSGGLGQVWESGFVVAGDM